VPVLERLGALGVRVAIDDFGIGNTSISQLRDLPVDALKIDRLFVADLAEGGRDGSEVVVQAMVDLAHSFELRVIAEGVEDEPTAAILRRLGVDEAQGFLYAAALAPEELRPARSVPRPRQGTSARRSGSAGAAAVVGSGSGSGSGSEAVVVDEPATDEPGTPDADADSPVAAPPPASGAARRSGRAKPQVTPTDAAPPASARRRRGDARGG
jgi:hypothetical protein